jgi:hypothetical protein
MAAMMMMVSTASKKLTTKRMKKSVLALPSLKLSKKRKNVVAERKPSVSSASKSLSRRKLIC